MSAPKNMRCLLRLAGVTLIAMLVSTCRDSAGNENLPTAGWLALSLTTPNPDDGGILFTIGGAAIDSVRSAQPHVITRRENASTFRVVIAGNLTAGVIGEIRVPDTREAAKYAAVILEVAARTSYQQRTLTGYVLSVSAAQTR